MNDTRRVDVYERALRVAIRAVVSRAEKGGERASKQVLLFRWIGSHK
jgi:hypothetical protein